MYLFNSPKVKKIFRFWLQTGTQVQVCTETASNVVISCVYLNENDMPGPIHIDVDSPSEEPFRVGLIVHRSIC